MAHQTFNLLWSRLFLTTFQFTFMPELYPGGLVGLPDHGLQLYIDGVTHTFDYESGFTTEAALLLLPAQTLMSLAGPLIVWPGASRTE